MDTRAMLFVVISLLTYFLSHRRDHSAGKSLITALEAGAIISAVIVLFNLFRRSWLLYKEKRNVLSEPSPNLVLAGISYGTLNIGGHEWPKRSLVFRNEPKVDEAVSVACVRAALRCKCGDVIRDISPLKWRDSAQTAMDIGVGETAELIIGMGGLDRMWDFALSQHRGSPDSAWIYEQDCEFEVRLINTKNGMLFKFPQPLTFRWHSGGDDQSKGPWIEHIHPPQWIV